MDGRHCVVAVGVGHCDEADRRPRPNTPIVALGNFLEVEDWRLLDLLFSRLNDLAWSALELYGGPYTTLIHHGRARDVCSLQELLDFWRCDGAARGEHFLDFLQGY